MPIPIVVVDGGGNTRQLTVSNAGQLQTGIVPGTGPAFLLFNDTVLSVTWKLTLLATGQIQLQAVTFQTAMTLFQYVSLNGAAWQFSIANGVLQVGSLSGSFSMPSSTVQLQDVVDDAQRIGELKPVLAVGGSSMQPALTIANIVMAELCSRRYNWKWNSFNVPPFQTISWQNDYAVPGITNLGWLENGVCIDINNSQIPKRRFKLEVVKELQPTSDSFGRPFQVCWFHNNVLLYGTWGSGATTPNANNTGQTNPGPGVVYTQPLGAPTTPQNPITQIIDPFGNIQVVTTFGTCGSVAPTWPGSSAPAGTTTPDGTTVWTAVDPKGQGFRIQAIPAQAGVVWQVMLRGQFRPVRFTSLSQFLDPIPDDFSQYFMQGFRTYCYQRSPEQKVRVKFQPEYELWLKAISDAEGQDDREPQAFGAYPSRPLLDGPSYVNPGPAWPFQTY